MKILLINNRHFRGGGADAVYFNTAKLLMDAGHQVVFFSQLDELNDPCEQELFFPGRGGKLSQIKHYFYNREAANKLEKLLVAEQPDVAHAHLFWGGLSSSIISVIHHFGIPLVHTAHDYRMVCPSYLLKDGDGKFCERCKGGKFYNCALHRCSKGSFIESILMSLEMYYRNIINHPAKAIDGILFVSQFSYNKHIEFDPLFRIANTSIIYNCPGEGVNKSLNLSFNTYESYYLYYGRLSVEKGVLSLIKAFERYPLLKLIIVGTGPIETQLMAYCKEKKLSNVLFVGYKNGKDLYDTVARAKYVCVPSECYENNPMTIVEAYSLSIPVIGASIGGISEIIRDGKTGFVFESGNLNSLTSAIDKSNSIVKEDFLDLKNNAYEFAKDNFSREKHLEKLLSFYKKTINAFNDN